MEQDFAFWEEEGRNHPITPEAGATGTLARSVSTGGDAR
jgi:hypothetical protein